MSQIVINADGTWAIGLQRPLPNTEQMERWADARPIKHVRLKPLSAEQIERWADGDYESSFGLLAEMTELPEKIVAQLGGADLTNVMHAFTMLMTPAIRKDFEEARYPLVAGYRRKPVAVTVEETAPEPEAARPEPEPEAVKSEPPPPPPQPPQPPPDFKGPVVIPTKRTHPLPPHPKDPRYPDISKMRVDESGAVVGITPPNVMERAS